MREITKAGWSLLANPSHCCRRILCFWLPSPTCAQESQDDAAIASGRDALGYLERFVRPSSVAENGWFGLKRRQQASAYFVIGRAKLHKALLESTAELRGSLLAESVASLAQAHSLNHADDETTYLFGVAQLSSGKPME